MERDGTYQKGRRRITQPVTQVPGVGQIVDSGTLRMRKTTGWLIAVFFLSVLGGAAVLGSIIFTKGHQIDQLLLHVREVNDTLEHVRAQEQVTERRLVQIETELENLKERR